MYNDRFEAIPITPDDVLPSWKDWAVQSKGPDKQNIHPIIMDFLEQAEDDGENYYYDFSLVEQEYLQDMDDNKMSTSSYPNYRTWEFLSNYIYECQDKGMQVQYSTIYGFIGKDHAAIFWGWLQDNKIPLQVTTESEGDPEYENWDTIVEDAILTRTPTLLASPSGIGKSTRVNNIAKKLNAIVIEVNLSELDRSDVMGPPAKVSTIDRIGGQVEDVDEDLAKELQDLAGGFDLPSKITVRAPKLEIAKKFQEAIDSGRRVVLNFEELNRVTNPAVMSAVFEAISDCFVGDTKIKLLDGTSKTIKEIHKLVSEGKILYVYSTDKEGNIVPGKIINSRVKNTNKNLVKVTLDNGEEIICTEDHKFMLLDGTYTEAKNLKDKSLRPLYTKISSKQEDGLEGYEMIKSNITGEYEFTHRVVGKTLENLNKPMIHHIDNNKLNNDPRNLLRVNIQEHGAIHGKGFNKRVLSDEELNNRRLEGLRKYYLSEKGQENYRKYQEASWSKEAKQKMIETKRKNPNDKSYDFFKTYNYTEHHRKVASNSMKKRWEKMSQEEKQRLLDIRSKGFKDFLQTDEGIKYRGEQAERCSNIWNNYDEVTLNHRKKEYADRMSKSNSDPILNAKRQLSKGRKVVQGVLSKGLDLSSDTYEICRKELKVNLSYRKFIENLSKLNMTLDDFLVNINHKVVSVEYLSYKEPVYDIEVEEHHNFALDSGVFVHNCRIFGITFDPSQVSILACCNMGDNFQDTQSLDPAFAARFNIHKKDSYSEDDVESIRDYVKDNYNQYMNGFIESLDNDALIDMVSQVETRSIETSVASTRALYDLNLYLEDKNTTSLTYGTCLLTERKYDRMMGSLNKVKDYNDNIIQELVKAIKDGLNNWCALDTKTTVTLGNEKVSAREVKQLFEECIKHLDNGETQYFNTLKVIISSISVIDKECQSLREKTIGYIVGPDVSTKFCEYYNTVSGRGTVTIEIEDLKDFSLYPAYLDAKLKGIAQPEQIKSVILKSYTDILDFFTLSLSAEHYREFILKGMDRLITSDLRLELLTTLVSTTSYDEMVKKAEENNPDIAKNFLDQCGVNTSSIDLTQFVQGSKTQASSSKKPRFL